MNQRHLGVISGLVLADASFENATNWTWTGLIRDPPYVADGDSQRFPAEPGEKNCKQH